MGIQKKNKTKNRKCRDCVFIFFFYLHERNPVKEGAEGRVTFAETSKQTIQKPRKSKWLAHATKFWLTTGFGTVSKGAGACACDAGFKTRNVLWSCFWDRLDRKLEWFKPFSCVLCYMLSVFVSIGSLRLTNRARLWKCVLSSEPLCGVHYYYFCSMDWYFCRDSWMVLRGCGQSFFFAPKPPSSCRAANRGEPWLKTYFPFTHEKSTVQSVLVFDKNYEIFRPLGSRSGSVKK